MSNRGRITRECEFLNRKRNVFEGIIDNRSFFQNIRGDLLVSGERAGDQEMILNLVESCMEKADMPSFYFPVIWVCLQNFRDGEHRTRFQM